MGGVHTELYRGAKPVCAVPHASGLHVACSAAAKRRVRPTCRSVSTQRAACDARGAVPRTSDNHTTALAARVAARKQADVLEELLGMHVFGDNQGAISTSGSER